MSKYIELGGNVIVGYHPYTFQLGFYYSNSDKTDRHITLNLGPLYLIFNIDGN